MESFPAAREQTERWDTGAVDLGEVTPAGWVGEVRAVPISHSGDGPHAKTQALQREPQTKDDVVCAGHP